MSIVTPVIGQALEQVVRHLGFETGPFLQTARSRLGSRLDRAPKEACKPNAYVARFGGKTRIAYAVSALLLGPALSGCILGTERPEFDLDIPAAYREAGRSAPDGALPALDWWRGFRSRELTTLMEAAQIYNLDIAVAVAQIVEADAQVGMSGAPLLPSVTGAATTEFDHFGVLDRGRRWRRERRWHREQQGRWRHYQGRLQQLAVQSRPDRKLHARFLGQKPRHTLRGRGKCHRSPLQPRSRNPLRRS